MTSAPTLLTLGEIADMHRCSLRHARDTLVRLRGFPCEAPTSTPRHRLWVAREISAFVHREVGAAGLGDTCSGRDGR